MKVTELAITTPYNEVVSLAVAAIINQDFEFNVSPDGSPETLYIFNTPDSATSIEMDETMFIEVYNKVMIAGGIPTEAKTIINSINNSIAKAA
jgi:uncharacterized protein YuzE